MGMNNQFSDPVVVSYRNFAPDLRLNPRPSTVAAAACSPCASTALTVAKTLPVRPYYRGFSKTATANEKTLASATLLLI